MDFAKQQLVSCNCGRALANNFHLRTLGQGHIAIGSDHASMYCSIESVFAGSESPSKNSGPFTIWLARKESVDRSIELVAAFEEVEFKYEDVP